MIKDKVKSALRLGKKTQKDFAKYIGTTPQNLNNKLQRGNTMPISDIINLATLTGGILKLEYKDGSTIIFDKADLGNEEPKNE